MNSNNDIEKMIEELGFSDCFVNAEEALDITSNQIFELRMKIDEKVTKNQNMLNCGIALLTLDEKFAYGEVDGKVYRKVRNELSNK